MQKSDLKQKTKSNFYCFFFLVFVVLTLSCGGGGGNGNPISGGETGDGDGAGEIGNGNGEGEVAVDALYSQWNHHCWDSTENVSRIMDEYDDLGWQFEYDEDHDVYYRIAMEGNQQNWYIVFFPNRTCQQICDLEYIENDYKDGGPYSDEQEHACTSSWTPPE